MKRLKNLVLPSLAALLVAGNLGAQPASPTPAPAPAPAPAKTVKLSAEEMKLRTTQFAEKQRRDLQRMQYLQSIARKENDVIKLNCVNDKLILFKAQTNNFDNLNAELQSSLETERRFELYEQVSQAAAAALQTADDANGCVGAGELKESSTDFTGPTLVDDPTHGLPFEIKVEPPAHASPFA
jgi:hypothetical protein